MPTHVGTTVLYYCTVLLYAAVVSLCKAVQQNVLDGHVTTHLLHPRLARLTREGAAVAPRQPTQLCEAISMPSVVFGQQSGNVWSTFTPCCFALGQLFCWWFVNWSVVRLSDAQLQSANIELIPTAYGLQ